MKKALLSLTAMFCIVFAKGQSDSVAVTASAPVLPTAKEDKALKYNLNDVGSHWFQVTFLNQTWVRYNESNPGTTLVNKKAPETFDIGLRRTRMQMFGQITDHTFLYFQFGMNNVNAYSSLPANTNRKVQAFFHDALCEYKVFKDKNWLKIGGGLTIANGLSRFSQPSISTIATLDIPLFLQSTVDQTDEFSRKLSIYARGQVGKIDYRFVVSNPYPFSNSGNAVAFNTNQATFAGKGHSKQYQTYLMYQFFEHEANTTPYMPGSYLGRKKIFNVAFGAIYQKDATWYNSSTTGGKDTTYNDLALFGVESFYDAPLNKEKGTAINLFAGFYSMNYGKNYLRFNGYMNPVGSSGGINPGQGSMNGAGNAYPMFGTGNSFYAQAGYLLKRNLLGDKGTLQPYASATFANYQALNDPMQLFDLGINWLIDGHRSKISLGWQLRPVYGVEKAITRRNSSITLQYQIAL